MRHYSTAILLVISLCFDLFLLYYPPPHTLDARLFYSPTTALTYLESLGELGRRHYRIHELADLTFIIAYSALLLRLAAFAGRLRLVCWLPGFFDVIETGGILILLAAYPNRLLFLATLVAAATPLKWASFLLVLSFYSRKKGTRFPIGGILPTV